MAESLDGPIRDLSENPVDGGGAPGPTITRRDLFRLTLGGGAGLGLGGLLDIPAVRAATRDMKLSEVSGTSGRSPTSARRSIARRPGSTPSTRASDRGLKRLAASLYEM